MFLLRAFVVWLVLMAVEVLHGALRTLLLAPVVGGFQARRIGGDLCQELDTRWFGITQRVFAIQNRLQQQLAEAVAKLQGMRRPTRWRGSHATWAPVSAC
jgi:hypothetical protein